jgi:hypothetical protein
MHQGQGQDWVAGYLCTLTNHAIAPLYKNADRVQTSGPTLVVLSGGMCCVRSVLMLLWRRHLRLIDDAPFLWRICIEHDAPLWCVCSQWTRSSLAVVRIPLRGVWTAHEQERIDSISLRLLTRHAKNARPGCRWRALTTAQVAEMLSLPVAYQRRGWM